MHYHRWWKHGDPLIVQPHWNGVGYDRRCEVEGCDRRHYSLGFCKRHYRLAHPERYDTPWNDQRRAASQKRRALKVSTASDEPVLLAKVRERDGDRCGICGGKIGRRPWPDPLSPSIDHMVPLSAGGAHSLANVQLAHLRCNVSKGARGGGEQLRLA